jgi:hypothetical protein
MVTYERSTGLAYSDAEQLSDWQDEISMARDHWWEEVMFSQIPQSIYRKARGNPTQQKEAASWFRQNGWKYCIDEPKGHWAIFHKGKLISEFKIAFQPPTVGKCRVCGEPLAPGYKADTHARCDVLTYLEGKIAKQKTIVVPGLN